MEATCSKVLVLKSSSATLKRMATTPKFLVRRRTRYVVVFNFTLIIYVFVILILVLIISCVCNIQLCFMFFYVSIMNHVDVISDVLYSFHNIFYNTQFYSLRDISVVIIIILLSFKDLLRVCFTE